MTCKGKNQEHLLFIPNASIHLFSGPEETTLFKFMFKTGPYYLCLTGTLKAISLMPLRHFKIEKHCRFCDVTKS